jgi:hypothetical protein
VCATLAAARTDLQSKFALNILKSAAALSLVEQDMHSMLWTCVCSTSRRVTRLAFTCCMRFYTRVAFFHFAWLCGRRSAPMHVTPKICNRAESVAKRVAYHNKSRRTLNKIESSPPWSALQLFFLRRCNNSRCTETTHHRVVCDEILSLLLQKSSRNLQ